VLGERDELAPGNDAIPVLVEHVEKLANHLFDIHGRSLAQRAAEFHASTGTLFSVLSRGGLLGSAGSILIDRNSYA
jgi:hypothetical protein